MTPSKEHEMSSKSKRGKPYHKEAYENSDTEIKKQEFDSGDIDSQIECLADIIVNILVKEINEKANGSEQPE